MDSLVVVVLTHGDTEELLGTDNLRLKIRDVLEIFNNRNCPNLRDRPKMFFLQACRGDKFDHGIEKVTSKFDAITFTDEEVTERRPTPAPTVSLPRFVQQRDASYSDMIVSYSTVYGFVSLRNEAFGSWYCTALAYTLVEKACDTELLDILRDVDREVQEKTSEDGYKQTTSFENIGFNKKLFFNPGV
jgi:hypothetical protein